MKIIGCDFHPSYQQIALVDTETGELWEGRLEHEQGEARRFYQALEGQTVRVLSPIASILASFAPAALFP